MAGSTSHTPELAWTTAYQNAKSQLSVKDIMKLSQITDYESCLKDLQSKNNKFSQQWPRLKGAIRPVLEFLKTFDLAITTCCQSNPEVACLVWGGVQIVLTVAAKYRGTAKRISEMLEQLSQSMPRFEKYLRHFPTNDSLHHNLVNIYETFVLFCARAFKFLDSRQFTVIVKVTWSSIERRFADAIASIKEYKTEMENDARAANIDIGFDREAAAEQRHHDMMSILPAALKRSNLIDITLQVPFLRNTIFFGRKDELNKIQGHFDAHSWLPHSGPCIVSIRGIGGVGKSQLALEYLFQDRQGFKGRFWIRSEDAAIIQQDLAQITKFLNKDLQPSADLKKAVQQVKDWLSTTAEKWLLVFDNVVNASDIEEFLPKSGQGYILVTTRDRDIADSLGQLVHTIELDGLQESDATALLREINPAIPHGDVVDQTVQELGRLPLAIYQMGSYMRQTGCTPEKFREILQLRSERFYSDTASITTLQYTKNLAQCCDMSISLLAQDEAYLLSVLAFFQTDEIQEELITKGCQQILRISHLADMCNWNDAIRVLAKHSLITVSQISPQRSLRMHRVIKRRAIHLLEAVPSTSLEAFQDAAVLLCGMFPQRPSDGGTMGKQWLSCELWLPHVLSVKETFVMTGLDQNLAPRAYVEILCNCAWYMWERGAEQFPEYITHAAEICDKTLSDDDALASDIYTMLGVLKLVRYQWRDECVAAFQKALEVRERYMLKLSQPSLDDRRMIANVYNNAGVGRLCQEQYPEAMILFQKSLALKYNIGDETTIPYDIGVSFYNICRIQMGQGLTSDAIKNAKKALELVEGKNGSDDFRTNQFRFTYAELLVASGDVSAGLALHEHTLEIRKRVMGDDNNDTGVSHYGLSVLYQQLSRLDDALISIEDAIKVFSTVPGAEDRLARSYFRKHLILKELNLLSDAQTALDDARRHRDALGGNRSTGDETMSDYDFIVSYYNK